MQKPAFVPYSEAATLGVSRREYDRLRRRGHEYLELVISGLRELEELKRGQAASVRITEKDLKVYVNV